MIKETTISVIGLGYVGLNLVIEINNRGCYSPAIYGIDTDSDKISKLKLDKSYINYIDDDDIGVLNSLGKFHPMNTYDSISISDYVIVCLPTPLNSFSRPDMSLINSCVTEIISKLNRTRKTTVIIESTIQPNSMNTILSMFTNAGYIVGVDFYLGYSPERIDPANQNWSFFNIPKIVSGIDDSSLSKIRDFYSNFCNLVVPVSSCRVAEVSKLYENIFRSVNIALVNEIDSICEFLNIDSNEVVEAAATKPYGFMKFKPGIGVGGHCIPIDPIYLTDYIYSKFGPECPLIEQSILSNTSRPMIIVERIRKMMGENRRILLLGVTYKPDVNDDRSSPVYKIYRFLKSIGYNISFHDPYIEKISDSLVRVNEITDDYDLVVIMVNHSTYSSINFNDFKCKVYNATSNMIVN